MYVGRVARTLEFQEGVRVQRLPGKTSVVRALLACLLASCPVWIIAGSPVPETLAASQLRTSMLTAPAAAARGPAAMPLAADDGVQIRHLVAPGETFSAILAGQGLPAAEVQAWQQAAASAYDVDAIQPRHVLLLTFTPDQGQLRECEYEIDKYALLSMRLVHGQIQARLKAMPQLAAVRGVAGRVESSLATSATAAGIPARMVSELADVFGWDVDLQADVRPGDQFRLVYAELRDEESGAARPGDILAAEITSGGRTLTAIRFENENGDSEYYDPDGHALGSRFLKYPLDFVNITSRFSGARMHPVLKRRAPHLGVDFAAPIGTPVHAVANGIITFAGYARGYGNQVGIEHETPYGSSYSHLKRIAYGVRIGAEVHKGQVIGYVGRSGMTTGPHLHFMLFRDGVYVNPLTVKLPTYEELTGARRVQFRVLRQELLDRLAGLGRRLDLPSLSLFSPTDFLRSKLTSSLD
jgi:murein DD-endopeptidase MepM/ murein hydrolase activator NlpD